MEITCPLCKSNDNIRICDYEGDFFSCKSINLCKKCNLSFANELPDEEDLRKYYSGGLYYDQVEKPFDQNFIEFSHKLAMSRLRLIENNVIFKHSYNVLDIGAGNSMFGVAINEKYDEVNYDAVEADPKIRNKYGDWVSRQYNDISEVVTRNYNLIVMNQLLEHLPNPVRFLEDVYKLLIINGFIFIDVPYKDYLFKPTVVPHLLFWDPKSMASLVEKLGLKMIFCDTVGMPHEKAKQFFNKQRIFEKIFNHWLYENKINRLMKKMKLPNKFNTFRQFQADQYGGERQWLRCIAQKVNNKSAKH